MAVLEITTDNFEKEVLQSEVPVLVDFWAVWCGPCQMQGPVIEEAAEAYPEIKVGKLNVDEQGAVAQKYGVMSIPTLIVFKGGEIYKKAVGFHSLEEIRQLLP
ncbi:MAG: thioredoxin [Lachnospiraceae bacterium]|jgi:thioredoxin 1|nr:thioredoxin [Lachnospiraceae bacterium]MCI8872759.1 thioredoxin [Lachnospiraceae bacterium]MCI9058593.1 thioredoxin [Lachnospiraceae bacterium]GFI31523.1 thioredoxin [Lachnospiraceae bacterium]